MSTDSRGNKKYSSISSILLVKLISVECRDSAFFFLRFSAFAGFSCFLRALISSKRKDKAVFSGTALVPCWAFCAAWPLQFPDSRPCCGYFCHNSDITFCSSVSYNITYTYTTGKGSVIINCFCRSWPIRAANLV
jgi:hypothetical protein